MSSPAQNDDFASIAKPHPAPPSAVPAGGDDFASIAKPHAEATAPADGLSMPTLHDLSRKTPENEHEGLYKMKDDQGNHYGVPYSNVEQVENFRNSFVDEDEARRYEKDHKAGDGPGWRDKLLAHTGPLSADEKKRIRDEDAALMKERLANVKDPKDRDALKKVHESGVETDIAMKSFTRGFANGAGTLALHPWESIKGMVSQATGLASYMTVGMAQAVRPDQSADPDDVKRSDEFRAMLHQMKEQYKSDSPYFLGQMAGQAVVAKGLHAAGAKVLGKTWDAAKAVAKDPKAAAQAVVTAPLRGLAGTGARTARGTVNSVAAENADSIPKAEAEHATKVREVEDANQEKREAHAKAVQDTNAHNEEVASTERQKAEIKRKLVPQRGVAPSRFEVLQDAAKRTFNKMYDRVERMVGNRPGDLTELAEGLETAKTKIQGSTTDIAVFKDIEKRLKSEISKGEAPPENFREMSPEDQAKWREERGKSGVTYKDLRGYDRELGKLIGSDSTPGDIKQAALSMRETLGKMQEKLASDTGEWARRIHSKASKMYKDYAETMLDRSGPASSATAKALTEGSADKALKHFESLTPSEMRYQLDLLEGKGEHAGWLGGDPGGKVVGDRVRIKNPDGSLTAAREVTRVQDVPAVGEKGTPEYRPATTRLFFEGDDEGVLAGDVESIAERVKTPVEERVASGDKTSRVGRAGRLRTMENYRADTAGMVREYLKLTERGKELGGYKDLPEHPPMDNPPEFVSPEKPLDEAAIHKQNVDNLDAAIERYSNIFKNRQYIPGALAAGALIGAVAKFVGVGAAEGTAGLASVVALTAKALGPILDKPWVRESLTKVTDAQRAELEKLPAKQAAIVAQQLAYMARAAEIRGDIPKGAAKAWTDEAKEQTVAQGGKKAAKPEAPPATPQTPLTNEEMTPQLATPPAETPAPPKQVFDQQSGLAPAPEAPPATQPEPVPPAAPLESPSASAPEPRNDHQPSRRLEDLKLDPKRFQYKLGGNKQGVTDALSDANWNQAYADPIHIWEDPADGEEYVINGHHRYDLAQKAGAERINTQKISSEEWPTAADARRFGALKNIADGNGTSVDAAKFMREKAYKAEDLQKTGLGLKKAVAKEGLALAKLSDDMFDRVVDGRVDPKIGAAIGEASDAASDQEAILKDVNRREKAGRPVTPEQIRESARLIKSSPTRTETTSDLFGDHEEERNLFLEMGEVSEYVQRELADERRVFKRVASKGASDQLARGKNVINPEENAKIATQAAQQRELYLKRSAQAGEVHSTLQEAAERLARGDNPNAVKQDAFEEIRRTLAEELGHTTD